MKINIELIGSMFDAFVRIRDNGGVREYMLSCDDGRNYGEFETSDSDFYVTVLPICADMNGMFGEIDTSTFKGKIATKIASKLADFYYKLLFRVGCQYKITNVRDGATLSIIGETYIVKNFVTSTFCYVDISYSFGNVTSEDAEVTFVSAKGLNTDSFRKNYKKMMPKFISIDDLAEYAVTAPFVNYYTNDKRINKLLKAFFEMTPEEQEEYLEKQLS